MEKFQKLLFYSESPGIYSDADTCVDVSEADDIFQRESDLFDIPPAIRRTGKFT
jgi:hypothetical protein